MNPFAKEVRNTEAGAMLVNVWVVIIGGGIACGLLCAAILSRL